ncbi:aromatic ring-hydroxylating dioxygenase subunit alpha [Novosphingobium sp. RD2P27]|uniref:Aromatic ring-hydroxylating dioxygenase subunit alpha n=1 Tax=Novosphingobium kalidii TaxID=3230299 RepID=A0ABV2D1Z5_9SPHN
MADDMSTLRREPHPISGAIYQELGDGRVRVDDPAKGTWGIFTSDGKWIEGDLTSADYHYLRYIGGPTLPAEKDIFWTMLPVGDLNPMSAFAMMPGRGGGDAQRPKVIAPYVPDPGKETPEGVRSSAHLPLEFFLENDRFKDRIPEVYKKSAPYPGGPKKVAVARFFEPKYHDLEMQHLWSKVWQMACREDDIPEVGDHILYNIGQLEYIVVRTAKDAFKAFPNACLHRGRRLCNHEGKKAALFRCPYHGWSWDIQGALKEITCEWDFPGVREDVARLPEAKVANWGGFVFINPDPEAISFEEYAGPAMIEHYAKLGLERRYKQAHVGKVIRANWKLIMEAFLEAYHSIATHPQLLLAGGDLAETRYDVFGNWSRLGHVNTNGSSAQRGIIMSEEQALASFRMAADVNREMMRVMIGDEVDDFSDTEMGEQSFNSLFPNFSPWGGWARIVYRFRPHGNNPDESLMEAILLAPWPKDRPKPPAAKLRMLEPDDPWVVADELGTLARIFDQDCGNVPDVHKGLKTKQPPYVIYSAYQESIIRAFHDRYERMLGLAEGE